MSGRWKEKWRALPWMWKATVVFLGVITAFYSIENFRGWWVLRSYCNKLEARGEWIQVSDRPAFKTIPEDVKLVNLYDFSGGGVTLAGLDSFDLRNLRGRSERLRGFGPCKEFPFEGCFPKGLRLSKQQGAELFLRELGARSKKLDRFVDALDRATAMGFEVPEPEEVDSYHLCYSDTRYGLARSLEVRASAFLAVNDIDAALRDIISILKLTDLKLASPYGLDLLGSKTNFQNIADPIWEGLVNRQWDEEQLALLAEALASVYSVDRLVFESLQHERSYGFHQHFCKMDELRERIDICRSSSAFFYWPENLSPKIPDWIPFGEQISKVVGGALFCLLPDGWIDLWLVHHSEQLMSSAKGHRSEPFRDIPFYGRCWFPFVYHGGPDYVKSVQEGVAIKTLAAVGVANERYFIKYGDYPQQLEALVPEYLPTLPIDPFSGEPYHYLYPSDRSDRPVVYSWGRNEMDDDGLATSCTYKGDIVWQYNLPPGFSLKDYDG